jgi:2-polyprenyl-3-methyl-5-hydroxy-6-metoxy-1,4-benzoquinol methylase
LFTTLRRIPREQYENVYSGEIAYHMMVDAAEKTANGEWGAKQLWWFKRTALHWIGQHAAKGRLLDVGSGPGTFLMVARSMGWEIAGVEPSTLAAEKACGFGIDTFNGVIEEFARSNGKSFDVATSFEVMEHVPDVMSMLSAIHSVLKPNGLFVFSVPNLDDPYCLRQRIPIGMPPIHINFFNRRSLSVALEKVGFEIIRFKSLPIPSSSVRNTHGKLGFGLRLPLLVLRSLLGKADGTTLLGMARRRA